MFTIYLITNNLNGKVYVGQTVDLPRRWRAHLQDARNGKEQPLYRAIRKYGKENFSIDSILTFGTSEEADYQERLWILLLGAHVSIHGYVCTWGDDGRTGINDDIRFKRVSSLRKTLAKDPTRHSRFRDDIKDEDLIRMYVDEKLTRRQISEKLNFSSPAITVRLRKYGVKVGQGRHEIGYKSPNYRILKEFTKKGSENIHYRSDLDTKEIVRLKSTGLSFKKIGKLLGCAAGTVKNRIRSLEDK